MSIVVESVVLKVEHHDEHPGNNQRGGIYRFTLDNYDENNVAKDVTNDLTVRNNPKSESSSSLLSSLGTRFLISPDALDCRWR